MPRAAQWRPRGQTAPPPPEAPPTFVALIVTVVVYALFYLGGRRLGLYDPLPEDPASQE